MTKDELLTAITGISKEHPQGIPEFIAQEFSEHMPELLKEGKVVKLKSKDILDNMLGVFYVLPENVEKASKELNLEKTEQIFNNYE